MRAAEPGLEILALADEHATAVVDELSPLRVGDAVRLIPAHVDPTVNLHPVLHVERPDAVNGLVAAHPGEIVVAVSHADTIKAAVASALGTPLDLFQRIVISPGSVSAISYVEAQAPAVLMVNSTSEPLSGLRAQ